MMKTIRTGTLAIATTLLTTLGLPSICDIAALAQEGHSQMATAQQQQTPTQGELSRSDQSLVARIPFSFSVQPERFPAGDYVLEPLQHGYLRLQGSDKQSLMVRVNPNYSHANHGPKGKLVFWRHGSEYFLQQVWIPSCDFGMEIASTSRQMSVEKQMKDQKELIAVQRQ